METRHENGLEAIKSTMAGFSSKQIAAAMIENAGWQMSLDSAAAKVRAIVQGKEYFKNSELVVLMRFTGNADYLYFMCDSLGLRRPESFIDPLEKLTELGNKARALQLVLNTSDSVVRNIKNRSRSKTHHERIEEIIRVIGSTNHILVTLKEEITKVETEIYKQIKNPVAKIVKFSKQ